MAWDGRPLGLQLRPGASGVRWCVQLTLCMLLWLCATVAHAAAPNQDWPRIPVPKGAKSYWIAQHIVHNTIPMQISAFDSGQSVDAAHRFYEQWLSDKRGYGVTQMADAQILGAQMGVFHITVELRAGRGGKGTSGRMSAAVVYDESGPSAEERIALMGKGFPRPVASDVLSDTVSHDPDRSNRTLAIRNRLSVEANALYLREQLIVQGWEVMSDKTVRGGRHSALVFRRGAEEMVVNISVLDAECHIVASLTSPRAR